MGEKIRYQVQIDTANEKKAGTNEDVWIQLIGTPAADGSVRQSHPTHLDKGGYNDFEKGDSDVYEVVSEDLGPITGIRIGLAAEGQYAGGIDLTVSASHKGMAADMKFGDIQKWGSQHNSPMWKVDRVLVYRLAPGEVSFMGHKVATMQPVDLRSFTIGQWIGVGDLFTIAAD